MTGFKGFREEDFLGIDGTCWRGRDNEDGLAKPLLSALRRATGDNKFESWAVPRETELHIAKRPFYEYQNAQPFAKLFVWLRHKEGESEKDALLCGYRIEKPNECYRQKCEKTRNKHWYWGQFIQNLKSNQQFKDELREAMKSLGLKLEDRLKTWETIVGPNNINWEEAIRELERYGEDKYLDLHICREIPKQETLDKGSEVINEILPVLVALVRIYKQTIGET